MGRPPKGPKRGGLSHEEKGKIIYLLQTLGESNDSYQKIAEDLSRPVNSIKKAVKEIKSIFVSTEQDVELNIKDGIIQRVTLNLIQGGVTKASAQAKINKILSRLTADEQSRVTEAALFQACLRLTTASDLMINTSEGGRGGVSIMTGAAAERGDDQFKQSPPSNPAVFKSH